MRGELLEFVLLMDRRAHLWLLKVVPAPTTAALGDHGSALVQDLLQLLGDVQTSVICLSISWGTSEVDRGDVGGGGIGV